MTSCGFSGAYYFLAGSSYFLQCQVLFWQLYSGNAPNSSFTLNSNSQNNLFLILENKKVYFAAKKTGESANRLGIKYVFD